MKLRLKNVNVYNDQSKQFEIQNICINDGIYVEDDGSYESEQVKDCQGLLLIPNFVSHYGLFAKKLKEENLTPQEIASRISQIYHQHGYADFVEQIDDFEVAKALGEKVVYMKIVSGNTKLLDKIRKLNKPNLKIGVVVDMLEDSPEEIDRKVLYAQKNGYEVYSNLYDSLDRAGEISTQYSKSPIEAAKDFGMLDGKFVSVGNVCLDKEDIVQMDDVKVCIDPKTNMYFGRGFEPLGLIKNHDKDVGFSVQSEFGFDMFENMRAALCLCRASMNDEQILSEEEVFSWATGKKLFAPKLNEFMSFILLMPPLSHKNIKNIKDLVDFASTSDIILNVSLGYALNQISKEEKE